MPFKCLLMLTKKVTSYTYLWNSSIANIRALVASPRISPTQHYASLRRFQHPLPCEFLPLIPYSWHFVSFDFFAVALMCSITYYSVPNHHCLFIVTFIIVIFNSLNWRRIIFMLLISKWLHLQAHKHTPLPPLTMISVYTIVRYLE